jgi:hypothetical protein
MRVGKLCALLRALELFSRNGKQELIPIPTSLTVEHILPQAWLTSGYYTISDMTDAQRLERDHALHTFGNLTLLTGSLNSSASNGPFHSFTDKNGLVVDGKRRKICVNSLLKTNAYFQSLSLVDWDNEAIAKRSEDLFDDGKGGGAVNLWSYPA